MTMALIVMVLTIAWVDNRSRNAPILRRDEPVERRKVQRKQQRGEAEHEEDQEEPPVLNADQQQEDAGAIV